MGKAPFEVVIGLLQTNFYCHEPSSPFHFRHGMHKLLHNNRIVNPSPTRYEHRLIRGDKIGEHGVNPSHNHLRDYLVHGVAQTNWAIIAEGFKRIVFGN